MAEEEHSVSSGSKTLLVSLALVGLIGLAALVILMPLFGDSCDGIFEQTAPKLRVHLEIIKNTGAATVGQEKIQDLSESAQKVGLHLKTCCKILEHGELDPARFQRCIDTASDYDRQIALVAQQVTAFAQVQEKGATDVLQKKAGSIDEAIKTATSHAEKFGHEVANIEPAKDTGNTEGGGSQTDIDKLPPVKGGYVSIRVTIWYTHGNRYTVLVNEHPLGVYESDKDIVFDRFLRPGRDNTISWAFSEAGSITKAYVKYEDTSEDWFHIYDFHAGEDRLQGGISVPFSGSSR